MRSEGGSFGFQIGASDTDVVMLVMNDGGMKHLLSDKFTLGGMQRLQRARLAAPPLLRRARIYSRKSCPIHVRTGCLQVFRSPAQRFGRTRTATGNSTTTQRIAKF
jgi:Las17-binding protein actin regulator